MSGIVKPPFASGINRSLPICRGLVGYWGLTEGSGNVVYDHSGNENHGIQTNMDPNTDWVGGANGHALDFDGTNDYVRLIGTASGALNLIANFTLFARAMSRNVSTTFQTLIGKRPDDTSFQYQLRISSGRLNLLRQSGATTSNTDLVSNKWHNCAAVIGPNVTFYLDGRADGSSSLGTWNTANSDVTFGGRGDANYLNGAMSCVAIFNRALPADEIALLSHDPWLPIRSNQEIEFLLQSGKIPMHLFQGVAA